MARDACDVCRAVLLPAACGAVTVPGRPPGLKSPCLYRHDLLALHSRQFNRFSLSVNRIPEKLVPRKFAMTTKVPDTKGCERCCVARNPYNGYNYLCGALPAGLFIMQWYDPLNKFLLLK
ncbi:Mitogen-activated protein kinase kinase kinase kinase 5 [Amphibalanus amphitrite]|uniref:Mitogen-activated protein kinase kinase kinase kinase 5 n=1 Tax=Amphibalanus amphitrite TaxID=1232801 RepID=A0A6A4WX97_AMPAM|nr:Mitogen-activated protein kinase kinase kinase kinase 5 [Amphibalanus amphitrite]